MASLYEQIAAMAPYAAEFGPQAALGFNPNDPSMQNPNAGMLGNIAWGSVPGMESFYSYDPNQNQEAFDLKAALPEFQARGYRWMSANDPSRELAGNWIVGPDGQPIADSARFTGTNDDRFKLAALAAGAVTGANIWAAAPGMAAAGGAQTFPVLPQAADVTTQLGALGSTAAPTAASTAVGPGLTAAAAPATSLATTGLGTATAAAPAASGAFNWGSLLSGQGLRSAVDILSGLYGMKLAGDAREQSDPFARYRPGYGQALAALEANPGSITQRPGWLAGTELIGRQMASRGYTGSGNEKAALSRYAGDFYNQEANRLATLAGAGQTPGAGQFGSAALASQSLGSIGYGIAPWLPNKP